ncbi:GNAT family N-acetyltransferase [Pseudonocardia sp. TRM90224]|uniref:GNAT family N-acetyltransferase n=1 Tax=Pseudonocardia sp. TRM90224 TaxID=2812678 RepID=UPI001E45365D|nr:GNAT family N-acetyltransferase [Pseudonocardia sp. TRM90224]
MPVEPPLPAGFVVARATAADAPELVVLQRCCWVTEAILNDTLAIPALHETLDEVAAWIERLHVWTVRANGRLVAAVRAGADGERWEIGRLMVAPDQRGGGLGRWLLRYAEEAAPAGTRTIALFTGSKSERNLRMYRAAGYDLQAAPEAELGAHIVGAVFLAKAV